jgi:hypothetical protein
VSAVPPSFRPRGAGTGLGPVPGADAAAAVALAVTGAPELPFWPSLAEQPAAGAADQPAAGATEQPAAGAAAEAADRRWAAELPGVAVEDGRPVWVGRSRAPGRPSPPAEAVGTLEPFLKALARLAPGWCLLPVRGPVSLALAIDAGGQPAFTVPSARGPFGLGYAARLRSLVTRVREALPAWKLVLLLDEPGLGDERVAARPSLATGLWRDLGATGAEITGVRLGQAPPPGTWPLVLDLDPRLVAFDAVQGGDQATDDPAFRRLVQGGTAVAWGLVDATSGGPEALARRLVDLVTWTAGDYLPEVMARSLVTPTGGLEGLSPEQAAGRLALTAAVAAPARDLAGLP